MTTGAISVPQRAAALTEAWKPVDLASGNGPAYALLLERPETKQYGND